MKSLVAIMFVMVNRYVYFTLRGDGLMPEIIELDDILSNKIAAGEVVERPASVVKELVENAIDAGSTIIEVEIEESGLGKIRVIDNGKGIRQEDMATAFKRHATSKLKTEHDLFRIRTLGFRGEALPSIASVSKVTIISAREGEEGTKVELEGGNIITNEKSSARRGTDITVTNLFYNTPARLKYIKSLHTEIGHISDYMNRLALSHPHISFRLRHNERMLLQTSGNGQVHQVLAAIYGLNVAKKMVPIKAESLDFKVDGFITLPEITRASRNYISLIVNGRFVKNFPLTQAVTEGYHTLLPIGRYPIVLLSIEMDPLLVDVNVHPAKLEVRISKDKELNALITEEIKRVFKQRTLIPEGSGLVKPRSQVTPQTEQTTFQLEHRANQERNEADVQTEENKREMKWVDPVTTNEPNELSMDLPEEIEQPPITIRETEYEEQQLDEYEETDPIRAIAMQNRSSRMPQLYPIGQMHGTYIFAQNELGLYMIDQHAAQERIKYEYYREKVGQIEPQVQELLVPLTFQFPHDEYIQIEEYKDQLAQVGVFLEEFGMNSYVVRSHPVWFPKGEEEQIIEQMIEQVKEMKQVNVKKLREEAAIMMSCKASIKANQYLRQDQIQALLDALRQTEDPFTCPHGRPVIIHYSNTEMEKMFKRIM